MTPLECLGLGITGGAAGVGAWASLKIFELKEKLEQLDDELPEAYATALEQVETLEALVLEQAAELADAADREEAARAAGGYWQRASDMRAKAQARGIPYIAVEDFSADPIEEAEWQAATNRELSEVRNAIAAGVVDIGRFDRDNR